MPPFSWACRLTFFWGGPESLPENEVFKNAIFVCSTLHTVEANMFCGSSLRSSPWEAAMLAPDRFVNEPVLYMRIYPFRVGNKFSSFY